MTSPVANRKDSEDFRFPVILPAGHPVIHRLIKHTHEEWCHVGTQGLSSILREKYWILGGRRTLRSVVSKCVVCLRHNAKSFDMNSPPLPLDRVRDAVPFEVVGVDFAGPMYLKSGEKTWVCLFTCAIYRAVHFELVSSLSTACFLQAFRRFVARRGRPTTVYSDNGTNFVGAENLFKTLNWQEIVDMSAVNRITWKFNPPTAAWWGGFWERLVGSMKQVLRKVLGRASLNYEDLMTLICDCEATVNARPLTYLSDDPKDLVALTPAMFLRDQAESGVPDCDTVDRASLCRRIRYKQHLRDSLRTRFRREYLGHLRVVNRKKPTRPISLGEMVLIGNDNEKRVNWPMGRIVEVLPGKDGKIRLVRVDTAWGQYLRPLQRIYPLECIEAVAPDESSGSLQRSSHLESVEEKGAVVSDAKSGVQSRVIDPDVLSVDRESAGVYEIRESVPKPRFTRSGRLSKTPNRFK